MDFENEIEAFALLAHDPPRARMRIDIEDDQEIGRETRRIWVVSRQFAADVDATPEPGVIAAKHIAGSDFRVEVVIPLGRRSLVLGHAHRE